MMADHPEFLSAVAQTKFMPPPLRPDLISRQALLQRLKEFLGGSTRLVLISAPAGYGKTSLLSMLPASLPGTTITCLSLGEEDNDPVWCRLRALLGAFRQALPGVEQAAANFWKIPYNRLPKPAG